MRRIIAKIDVLVQSYLRKVGFTIRNEKPKYVKRLWSDGIAAIIYSVVSIVLICFEEADVIVLMLNILCLFRATISNTISASQVTCRNDEVDIADQQGKVYKYYHLKATAYAAGFFFIVLAWVILLNSNGESNILIKIYSSVAIGAVLLNDIENDFVCAYEAMINPIMVGGIQSEQV